MTQFAGVLIQNSNSPQRRVINTDKTTLNPSGQVVTIPFIPVIPLSVIPPAQQNATSFDGNPVAVNFTAATASGGTSPYTFTYTIHGVGTVVTPGSSFPVGTTQIDILCTDASLATDTDSFNIVVTQF